jgi:HEAT repeat protein
LRNIFFVSCLLAGLFAAQPSSVAAQLTLDQAIEQLRSTDPTEVRTAIESFGLLGSPAAIGPLSERIRAGLPPELLGVAVDTLTVLGRREAGPVLFELLSHRRPEIRLLAVQAIEACTPPGADRALITSLSDSNPEVRALAATTLGEMEARSAVEPLFLALDHHIIEAGVALAHIVDAAGSARLLTYVGREPFATLRPILSTLMTRANLPARARLDVVARIGELATSEARALLEEVDASDLPARDPVRRAAAEAAGRIAE